MMKKIRMDIFDPPKGFLKRCGYCMYKCDFPCANLSFQRQKLSDSAGWLCDGIESWFQSWASEGFFPEKAVVDFSKGSQNDFSRGEKK